MMRGSPEKQTVNPQEVDKGRRRLLAGAATLVGAGVVIGALSSAEPAYAAVEGIVNFRDRRKRLNSTNSPSHDLQTTTIDISQGQPANVQDTPTPDATVIAVQRDKIIQDDIAARNQNNNYWLNTIAPIGTFAAVVGVVYAILNGQREQRIDREKRDEARFQEAVLALGKDETKLGAATTLRTFLDKKNKKSYKRFYQQIFDLSIGFLRLRMVVQDNPEPDPFYREIIRLFCESTPLVREMLQLQTLPQSNVLTDVQTFYNRQRKSFNASHIHLENADLIETDLSLADLRSANLNGAGLIDADLRSANLNGATLREADLKGANPEEADSLSGTKMWNVKNYSDREKRKKCEDKGATFDPPPAAPKTKGETK